MKVFGEDFIPGSLKLATLQLLASYTLHAPKDKEASTTVIKHIEALNHRDTEKTWYEVHFEEGDPTYINLNPGQFSAEKPEGQGLEFVKVKINERGNHEKYRVSTFLSKVKKEEGLSSETLYLIRLLETSAVQGEKLESEGAKDFSLSSKKLRETKDRKEAETIVSNLYRNNFSNYRMALSSFSSCMVLLQLQLTAGSWIAEDAYLSPIEYTDLFINEIAKADVAYVKQFIEYGHELFDQAELYHNKFLNTFSGESHIANLRLASHHYWSAMLIAKTIEKDWNHLKMDYTALLAEEGWVCCSTSILLDDFIFNKADYFPGLVADQILENPDYKEGFLSHYSSHVRPYFPRKTAELLFAKGLLLTSSEELKNEGFELLKEIEEAFYESGDLGVFEQYLINSAMMLAHQQQKNEKEQQEYAQRMAQSMIFAKVLGE